MTCIHHHKQGAEILMDYCAVTLESNRAAELIGHIRECADCRALVNAQQSLWESLDNWKPVEVSPDFNARLYARIAREQVQPAWRQWWRRMVQPAAPRPFWKLAAPLAAAGVVLTLALMMRMPDVSSDPADTNPVVRTEPRIDPDQVQQTLDDLDLLMPSSNRI